MKTSASLVNKQFVRYWDYATKTILITSASIFLLWGGMSVKPGAHHTQKYPHGLRDVSPDSHLYLHLTTLKYFMLSWFHSTMPSSCT